MRVFKTAMMLMMTLAMGVAMANTSQAQQDQTRFVLKLSDQLISDFKKFGSLKSKIPEDFRNKITLIELQHEGSKANEPVEAISPTSVRGNTATISLDDTMIGKVINQPVRIKVAEQGFQEILLNYTGTSAKNMADGAMDAGMKDGMKTGMKAPVAEMFFIKLSNGEEMAGSIAGFDSFKMETAFGDVSIPSEMIAGVRFHIDGEDAAVVILDNGDAVTGVPTIDAVSVATDWGTADVEPRFIESMTTAQNSSFVQNNTPFGSRWQLNNTTPPRTQQRPLSPRR